MSTQLKKYNDNWRRSLGVKTVEEKRIVAENKKKELRMRLGLCDKCGNGKFRLSIKEGELIRVCVYCGDVRDEKYLKNKVDEIETI